MSFNDCRATCGVRGMLSWIKIVAVPRSIASLGLTAVMGSRHRRTDKVIQDTGRNKTWIKRTLAKKGICLIHRQLYAYGSHLIHRQLHHHMRTDRLPTTITLSE